MADRTLEIVDPNMVAPPTDPQVTALPTDNEYIQAVAAGARTTPSSPTATASRTRSPTARRSRCCSTAPIFTVSVAFALDKSGPDTAALLEVLNEIVADMHADGTL